MKIADLFVNIALQGASQVGKGLTGISKGMSEVVDSSIAAKAAVGAVVFGLERLTGFASQAGMDLKKFALITGLSTDELQQWQYAFMKVDVSGSEVQDTIKGVSAAIAQMRLGKGAPEAMGFIGIDAKDADNTFKVMEKLESFAKRKDVSAAIKTQLLGSFGLSGNVIQGLMTMNREVDKLSGKQIISHGEIESLAQVNSAWKDFWFTLKTMGIKLVAREGLGAVRELGMGFKFIMDVGKNVNKLMNEFSALKVVAVAAALAIAVAFAPVTAVVTGLLLLMGEIQKKREGKKNKIDDLGDFLTGDAATRRKALGLPELPSDQELAHGLKGMIKGSAAQALNPGGFFGGAEAMARPPMPMTAEQAFAEASKAPPAKGAGAPTLSVNVHQYGVEHPRETARETSRGITDAARQLSIGAGGI